MTTLNEYDIQFLIEKLQQGEQIPEDYKYKLFPIKQKEYELIYESKMRKEDILANEDGVFPVPLQVEKVFNGEEYPAEKNGWRNMIVFGDNLQFLKTVYENKDPLIKDKVKGKVKLIYIDPPFGTGDEYDGNKGQTAYSARRKGADYVEFMRRRLILLHELLSDDGLIFVRQGYNFGHYIKVVLDEVFGKHNFVNEIIVNRGKQRLGGKSKYSTATDSVFLYCKEENYIFLPFKRPRYEGEAKGSNMLMKGERRPPERIFIDPDGNRITLLPPPNRHWKFVQSKIDEMYRKGLIYLAKSQKGINSGILKKDGDKLIPVDYVPSFSFDEDKTIDTNWTDISGYSQDTVYPTENSEDLLKRIILTGTNPGDLVLDCFAGSGTTAAVAEKLSRRWIVCDIGKLAFYTMQKRILTIESSRDLEDSKKKYGKKARSFVTINTGLYDLKKVFELKKDEYINFVMDLFEVEKVDKKISGITIDGQKADGYYVLVYPYWQFSDAAVDVEYIEDLHSHIADKIGERLYIIAPANYVNFISDYHEIRDVRYYFLKVPYQIIKELHKVQFKKLRQPQSKRNINDLDDAIGFHFIKQPEVESKLITSDVDTELQITNFLSNYLEEETGNDLKSFESLAMVLIDRDYNGKEFVMDEFYFAEDLLPNKKEDETDVDIKNELKQQEKIKIPLKKQDCGDKIMAVYVDIYGNEFKEILSLKR